MKVQAVFVGALLTLQEELAELGRAKRRSYETVVVHVRVD